jgi:hypothetical protein
MFSFEKALVGHCSPTLIGIKPANLLSLSKANYPQLPALIAAYIRSLAGKGISFRIVCECGCRWLLLVYRHQMLWEQLSAPSVQALLRQAGYPVSQTTSLETLLEHLSRRLTASEEFPHEIGLFLGYPLADVIGFCQHRGENCKLCGYWKVYGDVESAQRCFAMFDQCRAALSARLMSGCPLTELVTAACPAA